MGGTNYQNGRLSHAPSTAVWIACARYKDNVKGNFQWCGIQLKELEAAESDRSQRCSPTLTASTRIEDERRQRLMAAAYERRQRAFFADVTSTEFQCQTLRFQIGFAEPPENPWIITKKAAYNTQSSSDTMDNHQTSTFKRGVLSEVAPHFIVAHFFR